MAYIYQVGKKFTRCDRSSTNMSINLVILKIFPMQSLRQSEAEYARIFIGLETEENEHCKEMRRVPISPHRSGFLSLQDSLLALKYAESKSE